MCQHWCFTSDCRGPCLSRCVLCVVESQGSKSASPFHADLQPLICGSHEGGTSLKDVVRLSTFKLDISSSTGDQKHLRLVPEPPFLMSYDLAVWLVAPLESGHPPKAMECHERGIFNRLCSVLGTQ